MSTCRMWVKVLLLAATVAWAAPAQAGNTLAGANTDFPDNDLVMPFATTDSRSTFFSITNIGNGIIRARWAFFDASGEKVDEVLRDIFGEGGTDIVDITAIADRTIDGDGKFVLGPSRSLAGRNGFVIVYGDDTPRLLGNFTIANLTTNSAFGVNASGFGTVGTVAAGQGIVGTTFNPATLQDNLLVIIGLVRSGIRLFWHVPGEDDAPPPPEGEVPTRPFETAATGALLVCALAMSVFAAPLMRQTDAIAAQLLAPQQYLHDVRGTTPQSRQP